MGKVGLEWQMIIGDFEQRTIKRTKMIKSLKWIHCKMLFSLNIKNLKCGLSLNDITLTIYN